MGSLKHGPRQRETPPPGFQVDGKKPSGLCKDPGENVGRFDEHLKDLTRYLTKRGEKQFHFPSESLI